MVGKGDMKVNPFGLNIAVKSLFAVSQGLEIVPMETAKIPRQSATKYLRLPDKKLRRITANIPPSGV